MWIDKTSSLYIDITKYNFKENPSLENFFDNIFRYKDPKLTQEYKEKQKIKFQIDKLLRSLDRDYYCWFTNKEEYYKEKERIKNIIAWEKFYDKARTYYKNIDDKTVHNTLKTDLYKQIKDSIPKWVLSGIAQNFKSWEVDFTKLLVVIVLIFVYLWIAPILWMKVLFAWNKYISWDTPDISPILNPDNLDDYKINKYYDLDDTIKDQTGNYWLDDTIKSSLQIDFNNMTNDQVKELAVNYEKEWKYLDAYPARLELAENRYKDPTTDEDIYLQSKYLYYAGRTYIKWTSYIGSSDAYDYYQKSLNTLSQLKPLDEITKIDNIAILTIQILEDCANVQRELARNEQNQEAKKIWFESAIDLLTKALNLNKIDPDWEIYVAKDHNDIWEVYFLMWNYEDALKEYKEAIDIKNEIKQQKEEAWVSITSIEKSIATSYLNAWKTYLKINDLNSAKDYLDMAYDLKVKYSSPISECVCALWDLSNMSLDFDKAKEFYQMAYWHAISNNTNEVLRNIENEYEIYTADNMKMENNLVVALEVAYNMMNLLENTEIDWQDEYEMRANRVIHLMEWVNTQQRWYYWNIAELNKQIELNKFAMISAENKIETEQLRSEQMEARLFMQKQLMEETEKRLQAEWKAKNELANKLNTEEELNKEVKEKLSVQKDLVKETEGKFIAERRAKRYFWIWLAISTALSFVITYLWIDNFRKRKKTEELKKDLESKNRSLFLKNEVIKIQKEELTITNGELTSSIKYASRIPDGLLPKNEDFEKIFPNKTFIIFNPSKIISWDYYWFMERKHNWEDEIHIIAWDCTGHGVPWWLLSTMMSTRQSAVMRLNNLKDISTDWSLNMQRDFVVEVLSQDADEVSWVKDWADLVYTIYNKTKMLLEMSGAYNSVFVVRKWGFEDPIVTNIWSDWEIEETDIPKIKGKDTWFKNHNIKWLEHNLIELKWDKMPVWVHLKEHNPNFTKKTLKVKEWDRVYLFGDWLQDQFGWDKGSKFLSKNLRKLILESQHLSMKDQWKLINSTVKERQWDLPQTDDQVMIAFEI